MKDSTHQNPEELEGKSLTATNRKATPNRKSGETKDFATEARGYCGMLKTGPVNLSTREGYGS